MAANRPRPNLSEDQAEDTPGREDVVHDFALSYKKELPWADAEAIEINLSLLRANCVLTAAVSRQIEGLNLGVSLSGARFTLLRTLYFAKGDPLPQNEISRRMGVSRTNITNLIDGLERDGLVTRVTSPADRRVSYARLTPAGEDACTVVLPVLTQLMGDACRNFSDEEKSQFLDFLTRIQYDIEDRFLIDAVAEGVASQTS